MRVSKETIIPLLEKGIHIRTSMQKSIMRSVHFAIIMKRGKILDVACNAIGSRTMGCGYTNRTIHAERAVIKKIGDHTKLDGAIMVVIRISRGTGEIMNSISGHISGQMELPILFLFLPLPNWFPGPPD